MDKQRVAYELREEEHISKERDVVNLEFISNDDMRVRVSGPLNKFVDYRKRKQTIT